MCVDNDGLAVNAVGPRSEVVSVRSLAGRASPRNQSGNSDG
jgi:hypothetical protein